MEELTERVDSLELETERINFIINGIQKRSKSQETDTAKIKADIADIKANMRDFETSVDKRFEHVYGELADLKANTADIRNILATVVQRQEKQSELLQQILAKLS
jgi:CRISPR/Cas system CSM-associated protein Csm2 small subunit